MLEPQNVAVTLFWTKQKTGYYCWVESELYGPSMVRQILDGNHLKIGENAGAYHNLTGLVHFVPGSLFQATSGVTWDSSELGTRTDDACKDSTRTQVKRAHVDVVSEIGNLNILQKMSTFEAANSSDPMFKVMHHYMAMEMLAISGAVQTRDSSPHLIL